MNTKYRIHVNNLNRSGNLAAERIKLPKSAGIGRAESSLASAESRDSAFDRHGEGGEPDHGWHE
jgi:hypothetical protein